MVYNQMKDKIKEFLKPFAETGQPVSAEDIKAYFAKLRGDDEATRAGEGVGVDPAADNRREQSGMCHISMAKAAVLSRTLANLV